MVDFMRLYIAFLAAFEALPTYNALVLGKLPYFVPEGGAQLAACFVLLLAATRVGAVIADDHGSRLTLALTHIVEAVFFAFQAPHKLEDNVIQIAVFVNAALFAWHAARDRGHRKNA